jgi:hypothetical protein
VIVAVWVVWRVGLDCWVGMVVVGLGLVDGADEMLGLVVDS